MYERVASPGLMHDTGCLGLVHWDDPKGCYGGGGGRRVQDGVDEVTEETLGAGGEVRASQGPGTPAPHRGGGRRQIFLGFPCGSAGKESACNVRDLGSILELGRCPGEGKGCPLQYSGLENSMDWIVY